MTLGTVWANAVCAGLGFALFQTFEFMYKRGIITCICICAGKFAWVCASGGVCAQVCASKLTYMCFWRCVYTSLCMYWKTEVPVWLIVLSSPSPSLPGLSLMVGLTLMTRLSHRIHLAPPSHTGESRSITPSLYVGPRNRTPDCMLYSEHFTRWALRLLLLILSKANTLLRNLTSSLATSHNLWTLLPWA